MASLASLRQGHSPFEQALAGGVFAVAGTMGRREAAQWSEFIDPAVKFAPLSAEKTGMRVLRAFILLAVAGPLCEAATREWNLPLFFAANRGQAPKPARYIAHGAGVRVLFSPGEARFELSGTSFAIRFDGGNPEASPEGTQPLPGRVNFLSAVRNRPSVLDVPLYGAVLYRSLYPGINMVYGGQGRYLKSEFLVRPGADPSLIRVRYLGAGALRIDGEGALIVSTSGGDLRQEPPESYQEAGGIRTSVESRFFLNADGTVSFHLGAYDISRPLTIDPVITYSTLLGGSGAERATSVAVDSAGSAYLTGFTDSTNFPTVLPFQNANRGGNDVFVAKLSASGSGLIYCTYIGGSGDDRGLGIRVDGSGAAYVTGATTSHDFPVLNGFQTRLSGSSNAFVLKLNAAGNALIFSTYLGGNGSDKGNAIALDSSGNAYVTGDSTSTTFPTTGLQRSNHGGQDAFVVKISADGRQLIYSTYLGGNSDDTGSGIAVDAGGNAYVTGGTYSSDFPVVSAFQPHNGGGQDAFVAKLGSDGASLKYSSYFGGSGGQVAFPELAQGIALDNQGNAYITGITSSVDFPVVNPLQASLKGAMDAFVAKVDATGALIFSTYLGGSSIDVGNAIAVGPTGRVYVAGYTISTDLPVLHAIQTAKGGDYDAFLAVLNSQLNAFDSLTYLGGDGADSALALGLGGDGEVYLAGFTLSTNFPLLNAYQTVNSGVYGVFATKVVMNTPTPVSITPASGSGSSGSFQAVASDAAGYADLASVELLFGASANQPNSCDLKYDRTVSRLWLLNDAGTSWIGPGIPGSGTVFSNSQCSLNMTGAAAVASGAVLTVTFPVTFTTAFSGQKNAYLSAANVGGDSSGYQGLGTWTLTTSIPSPTSLTPSSGSAATATFQAVVTSSAGFADIASMELVFHPPGSWSTYCDVKYDRPGNRFWIVTDSNSWAGPSNYGTGAPLSNSQCSLTVTTATALGAANTLTVTFPMTFTSSFSGIKEIDIYAVSTSGQFSGYQTMGTWTVPGSVPTPVSVSPSSGNAATATFQAVVTSSVGFASIASMELVFHPPGSWSTYCDVKYDRPGNRFWIVTDSNSWAGPSNYGTGAPLSNSQCSLTVTTATALGAANTLTVTFPVTFTPGFSGAKEIDIYAVSTSGQFSGYQTMGTWTVP